MLPVDRRGLSGTKRTLKRRDIMKKATITLAILLFAGAAYGDAATVLRGTKVENWLIYENDGDIQVIGPQGQAGFGQTDGDQTWIYVPDGQGSTYTVTEVSPFLNRFRFVGSIPRDIFSQNTKSWHGI